MFRWKLIDFTLLKFLQIWAFNFGQDMLDTTNDLE
jgi:hypothetical protein